MNSIRRYMQFVKPYWKQIALTMIVGILKFAIPLTLPLLLKYVVDDLLLSSLSTEQKVKQLFYVIFFAFFLFTVIRYPVEYYRQYFAQWTASRVLFDIRNRLFDHLQKLSMSFYNNNKVGQIISRVINDVEQTKEFVITGMMNIWLDFITLSIAVSIMLWLDFGMTLVSLAIFPIYVFAVKYFFKNLRMFTRERSQALADLQGYLHERIQGIAVIRAFHLEDYEQKQFEVQNRRFLDKALQHTTWTAKTFASINTITDLAPILVIAVSAYQVIYGQLSIGKMAAFFGYLNLIYSPVRRLVNSSTTLTQAFASMDRMFEFLDESYEIVDQPHAVEVESVQGKVEFDQVFLRYPGTDRFVLEDLSLTIPAGKKVAIVGPSGGGKSSFISLIPRFYDVSAGSVRIDDRDIREYSLKSLRGQIGMVLQDPILFSGSVEENIRMGKVDASFEAIVEAAKAANAHDFIMSLPDGYHSEIGERGVKLSGGQKQRIALARVFLKNPRIFILDEATSALDLQSEQLIQESIERLAKNRTTIIVAHRLSTITDADLIVVIDQGRVVEQGTHSELMAKNGLYAELYNVQNLSNPTFTLDS